MGKRFIRQAKLPRGETGRDFKQVLDKYMSKSVINSFMGNDGRIYSLEAVEMGMFAIKRNKTLLSIHATREVAENKFRDIAQEYEQR